MQLLKCQQDLVAIHMQARVGLDIQWLDKLPKTQVLSLPRPKLIYVNSNYNKSFVASEFRLNTHRSCLR